MWPDISVLHLLFYLSIKMERRNFIARLNSRSKILSNPIKNILALALLLAAVAANASQFKARDVSQVVVARNGTMFASANPGMFRSTDQGANWTRMPVVGNATLGVLVITAEGKLFVLASGELFRSTDGGTSFKKIGKAIGPNGESFYGLSFAEGALFAESNGLFKSADEGKTWKAVTENASGVVLREASGKLFFGGGVGGVVASDDKGGSWKHLPLEQEVRSLAIRRDGALFAGVDPEPGPDFAYILTSQDKGKSWKGVNRGLPGSWGATVKAITAASDGAMYAAVTGKIFRLEPGGSTWADRSRGLPGTKQCLLKGTVLSGVNSIAQAPNGDLYAGTRHGVFVSHNQGEIWAPSLILETGF